VTKWERIGRPMTAEEILALRGAVNVLHRYSFPGVVQVMETIVRDEEAKRRRMNRER
jgi:hypothetical protein